MKNADEEIRLLHAQLTETAGMLYALVEAFNRLSGARLKETWQSSRRVGMQADVMERLEKCEEVLSQTQPVQT